MPKIQESKEIGRKSKSPRRKFYKDHVDRKLKIVSTIFIAICIFIFLNLIYDSLVYGLPFYYIVFFFIGFILGHKFKRIYKTEWDADSRKIMRKFDDIGITLLIILIATRVFLSHFINIFQVTYAHDAMLLLLLGTFSGRVYGIKSSIEHIVFHNFISNNKKSDEENGK